MSLDVFLTGKTTEIPCRCEDCDNLHTRRSTEQFYDSNITHNLGKMAERAGIYKHLWRPEEIGITKAGELIQPLRNGLARMMAEPDTFKKFDADNGWGTYKQFIPWIKEYLKACETYPDADVRVSR